MGYEGLWIGVFSWDLRDFPFVLLSCLKKLITEMEILSEDARES